MRKQFPKAKPALARAPRKKSDDSWAVLGFDLSMSSLAGSAMWYDATLERMVGPDWMIVRWNKDQHYYDRLEAVSRGENHVHDLLNRISCIGLDLTQIYIAIEEAVPFGMLGKRGGGTNFQASYAKQQIEINGAFLGGLLRYGYTNLYQVNNASWQSLCCKETGIPWKEKDKWLAKHYTKLCYPQLEELPDLIKNTKLGKIPKPEGSRAKPIQPDDRYDTIALLDWMRNEIDQYELGNG